MAKLQLSADIDLEAVLTYCRAVERANGMRRAVAEHPDWVAGCRAGTPAVQEAAREAASARSILKQAGLARVRLEGEAPFWGLRFSFPGFDLVAAPAEGDWSVRAEVPICTKGRAVA